LKEKPIHSFVPLETLSFDSTSERGGFKGHCNLKGYLETNYGSIFYGNNIYDYSDLLSSGFMPDSHGAAQGFEYTIGGSLGTYPVAKEDDIGLYVEGKFHSTLDAQSARTKIRERIEDGVSMGLSIGFWTLEGFRIYPKDYETQLPLYLKPEYLVQGLEDAKMFPSILIRTKVKVFENSVTPMPAMAPATISQILSKNMNSLSKYMGGRAEGSAHYSALSTLCNALAYNDFYEAAFGNKSTEESTIDLQGALSEFSKCVMAIHSSICAIKDSNDNNADDVNQMAKDFRSQFSDPEVFSPLAGLQNKEHGEAVLATVKAYLDRQFSLAEIRRKEILSGKKLSGKVVSKSNHSDLKKVSAALADHCDGVLECKNSLDEFLDKYDPNAETQSNNTEQKANELRASLLRNKLLA